MNSSETWNFRSVAVVGSGALGLYYGGRLAEAGEQVSFLARSGFEELVNAGLRAKSIHGDFDLPTVVARRTTQEIGPVDLVIIALKATSNAILATLLPPLLHPGTQVLTLQNGLGNCEKIAEIVGPERVLGGLCFVCVNRHTAAQIDHSGGGRVSLGEWLPNQAGRSSELVRRFQAAKIPAEAVGNLEKSQWEKLVWNIPFNGLSITEGGVTTADLLARPETEQEIRAIMAEVIEGANALGFDLVAALAESNIARTRPMGPYRTSSMLDFINGQPVEVDSIWSEPLRRATAAGVKMPHTADLLRRIRERLAQRSCDL